MWHFIRAIFLVEVGTSLKPDMIVLGAATWSIKLHNGSTEALNQYKTNLTSMAQLLEKLAEHGEVIWVLQDPVLEDLLRDDRKMITNQQIDLYNEAALSILNSINSVSKAKVQILRASRLAAEQTIGKSLDGLHIPKSTRDIILAFILIRNIPGYARSVYSSFFAWFGKISLELFICQYHIWLAADTKGILVLIPGNPVLNIIISTFIFVCVAHEISQITNELAQIAIPKDGSALLKRLLGGAGFLVVVLFLSAQEESKL
ncbi:UNVERIFIED_CONTAM: hypothetical protein FKN15_019503 [Acipenser sinensis]